MARPPFCEAPRRAVRCFRVKASRRASSTPALRFLHEGGAELRFNARLFELWLNPKADGTWTSERQWFFDRPKDAPPPKTLDLRAFAIPQPFLVRNWREPKIGPVARLYLFNTLCLAAGLVLLALI